MSDDLPDSLIPYDEIVQEALRAVVGRVLGDDPDTDLALVRIGAIPVMALRAQQRARGTVGRHGITRRLDAREAEAAVGGA